jgi:hypothetical protein
MTVNWTTNTPSATITSANNVNTAAFDASYNSNWDDVSQPGTTQKLDGIGGIIMYRGQWKTWEGYNSVVLNWAVKINNSQRSIKWCELRQDQSTGIWSMYQEGIYTPDSDTRWMGSIIMDDNGSIGLSYMKSNTTTSVFPGLYFTGRRACDPLGELPITEVIVVEGSGSQTGTNRNGDYAHGCLDPDGMTIWSTSEYMGGQSGFSAARTRVFSYQIEPCIAAAVSIELVGTTNPICANEAITLTATPAYGGDSPQYEWYINGNALNLNEDNAVIVTPQNGDIITCTMISNEPGLEGVMVTSNEVVLEIATSLEPQVSVTSAQEIICEGEEAMFIAIGTHLGSNPTYQWFVDGTAVGSNNDSLSYTFTSAQNVTCTVTSSLSCASPAQISSEAFVATPQETLNPEVTITASTDTISPGQSITFTATAINAGSSPAFQWYINGLVLSGATASTYTSNTIGNGQTITCRIVGQVPCSSVTTVTSNGITIVVEQPNSIIEWNNGVEVLIYPNPSMGEVTFKSIHAGTYYIVNEAGQLVQEVRLHNTNNFEVKINNLASGSYLVAGQNDFGVVKERLIIVR